MKHNFILDIEVFDCWGTDFMSPFSSSYGDRNIVVAVDYVSKWVESVASPPNDVAVVVKFFKSTIFPRFGVPQVVIRTTPFRILYRKSCHLPVELEHKAAWAVKLTNFDIKPAVERRFVQLNELDEIIHFAYENSKLCQERTKAYHEQVLLYKSRLTIFPGKLRSPWSGPLTIKEVRPYGAITLISNERNEFTVNVQRVTHYWAKALIPSSQTMRLDLLIVD
ncbi:hypothetical protein N665_0220s0006 [Sinapis alba]|nr:hypothetical protein N665_0220s0006 [Sinapis alba]